MDGSVVRLRVGRIPVGCAGDKPRDLEKSLRGDWAGAEVRLGICAERFQEDDDVQALEPAQAALPVHDAVATGCGEEVAELGNPETSGSSGELAPV